MNGTDEQARQQVENLDATIRQNTERQNELLNQMQERLSQQNADRSENNVQIHQNEQRNLASIETIAAAKVCRRVLWIIAGAPSSCPMVE